VKSILGLILLASLLFFPLSLPWSHPEDKYLRQGDELIRRGEIELASQEYHKAIEKNPRKAEVYVRLGKIYDLQGKPAEAISTLTKAVELEPYKPENYYYLAVVHEEWAEEENDYLRKAIIEYRKALELNPNFVEARFRLANLYRQLEEEILAIAEFMEAVKRASCILVGKVLVENRPLASAELNFICQPENELITWSGVEWTTFTDSFGNYLLPFSPGSYRVGNIVYLYGDWDPKKDYVIVSNFPSKVYLRKKITVLADIKLVPKIKIICPLMGSTMPAGKIIFQWYPYPGAGSYFLEVGEFTCDQFGNWQEKTVLWRRQNIYQSIIAYNDNGKAVASLLPGKNYYAILYAFDWKGQKLSSIGDDETLSWHFTVKR